MALRDRFMVIIIAFNIQRSTFVLIPFRNLKAMKRTYTLKRKRFVEWPTDYSTHFTKWPRCPRGCLDGVVVIVPIWYPESYGFLVCSGWSPGETLGYRRISAVKQCRLLQGSQSKNLLFFEFPRCLSWRPTAGQRA